MKQPRLVLPVLAFALAAVSYPLAGGAPPKKPSTSSKTPSAKSSKSTKSPKSSKTSKTPKKSRKAAAPRPRTQQQPTPDRIREVQQALTEKGYPVAVTGTWGEESVSALKRYQEAQNLNGRGKLDSLTLISLGLGPKREPAPPAAAPTKEIKP